jgi:Raf kinase inhibitor-like YbhB/YbcL family protein
MAGTIAFAAASNTIMKISSNAFEPEKNIPVQYSCDGANTSPELSWTDVPADAKTLALVMEDPDAPSGTYIHWVAYNIPPTVKGFASAVATDKTLPDGTLQGENSSNNTGYTGPCPPPGHGSHRYYFRLYALDQSLDLKPGATRTDLNAAMKGHILAQSETMGRFERK